MSSEMVISVKWRSGGGKRGATDLSRLVASCLCPFAQLQHSSIARLLRVSQFSPHAIACLLRRSSSVAITEHSSCHNIAEVDHRLMERIVEHEFVQGIHGH
jgi:hypothetical protein